MGVIIKDIGKMASKMVKVFIKINKDYKDKEFGEMEKK
jgi:hypothetical protein